MNYDIIIIGAGPGGIFAAYELICHKPELKVAVFEAGHPLAKRRCPIDGEKIKTCIGCKSCSIMSGFGGAGAFSDGKYNITNDFGGTLYEYIGKKQALELMYYVDAINLKSTSTLLFAPRCRSLRFCRTRRSFACKGSGNSPISSKSNVPPFALSIIPILPLALPPVNAPGS